MARYRIVVLRRNDFASFCWGFYSAVDFVFKVSYTFFYFSSKKKELEREVSKNLYNFIVIRALREIKIPFFSFFHASELQEKRSTFLEVSGTWNNSAIMEEM